MNDDFEKELTALLNKHSVESESGTPDYILARYLMSCLEGWNHFTRQRDYHTGVEQRPSL